MLPMLGIIVGAAVALYACQVLAGLLPCAATSAVLGIAAGTRGDRGHRGHPANRRDGGAGYRAGGIRPGAGALKGRFT